MARLLPISSLVSDALFLETLLLDHLSHVTLHLILWGGDQVCHPLLTFVTHLISLCSYVAVRHLLRDVIYSLI